MVTMDTTASSNAAFTVKFLDNVTKHQGNVKEDAKAVGKYRTVMVVNVNYITVKKASMGFFWVSHLSYSNGTLIK